MEVKVVLETNLSGLKLVHRGKVRDLYALDENLLIVATDRISAFDVVLPTGIPRKGEVLTAMTLYWLAYLADIVESHHVTSNVTEMGPAVKPHADLLKGRAERVRKAQVFPIECVVRGYLAGSAWREHRASGAVCGIRLRAGLREAEALPEPIFTPTTKAASGHDQPLSFAEVEGKVGKEHAAMLRDRSLLVYRRAHEYAGHCGIILADTKLEWGLVDGRVVLVDEVLTPDSSRFWPAAGYEPGKSPPSYDKQYVRDYLESLEWDKKPPAPALPDEVVRRTTEKYLQAYQSLTGQVL